MEYVWYIRSRLTERVVYSEPAHDGRRFVVVANPSVQQFATMLANSRQQRLRMLARDGHIYVWDAYYLDHDVVAHSILGAQGGPAQIGVRLEANSDMIEYGKNFEFSMGPRFDHRNLRAVEKAAKMRAQKPIGEFIRAYPRILQLCGDRQVHVHATVHTPNDIFPYADVKIGPLNSFMTPLTESAIQPGTYGGWIDPRGGVHEVDDAHQHLAWLDKHLRRTEGRAITYSQAFAEGYVRFVTPPYGMDNLNIQGYEAAIRRTFRVWYPALRQFTALYVEIVDHAHEKFSYTIPADNDQIRQRWGTLAESNEYEIGDYGYWIFPDGRIANASSFSHYELAANQLGVPFPEDDTDQQRSIMQAAMEEGSIKVTAAKGSTEISFEFFASTVTREARRSASRILADHRDREAFIVNDDYFTNYREAVRALV